MANLSLPRQLIKIYSLQAIRAHWTSSCLPYYCKIMTSFELNYANLSFQLPGHVQSFIQKFATGATDPLMTHCRCELFHEAWKVLLDEDFIHAHLHVVIMDYADGIR